MSTNFRKLFSETFRNRKYISNHTNVEAYLDNDKTGRKCLSRLQESCPGTRFWDASGLYAEHNDLNEYLINEKSTFNLKNDVYFVKNTNSQTIKIENIENNVNFDFFMNDLLDKKLFSEQELLIFLPYIAWLRKNTNINDFEKLQKLALSSIVRYNNKV